MRILIVVITCCVLFGGGLFIYSRIQHHLFPPPLSQTSEAVKRPVTQAPEQHATPPRNISETAPTETDTHTADTHATPHEIDTTVIPNTYDDESKDDDWRTAYDGPAENQHDPDPWGQWISQQEKNDSDRIHVDELDTVDPDRLVDFIEKQLILQFGDTPVVQTFMEFKRKRLKGVPLTLDEKITYTEAKLHLFPHEKTRVALNVLRWRKRKGPNPQYSEADVAELLRMGVKIRKNR